MNRIAACIAALVVGFVVAGCGGGDSSEPKPDDSLSDNDQDFQYCMALYLNAEAIMAGDEPVLTKNEMLGVREGVSPKLLDLADTRDLEGLAEYCAPLDVDFRGMGK